MLLPNTDLTRFDFAVVGSGFGGAVAAMRLAEKGYSVIIIEKGQRWHERDFPKTNWYLKKFFWLPQVAFYGIQKLTWLNSVFVLSGVGLGGGSLVYANTHMYPSDEFFKRARWPDKRDWQARLKPYYQMARFMLGTTKSPYFNREDELLYQVAKQWGCAKTFAPVEVGVYFGDKGENVDPYFQGLGPKRQACTACAGCMVGCQYGAKNTLDKNYLYFACDYGAKVLTETEVMKIEREPLGYILTCRSVKGLMKKKSKVLANKVVVASGVLGTLKLLMAQKYYYKTLPKLSSTLGENFRTNSESLLAVTTKGQKLNNGLAITSVVHPDNNTHVQIVKYPNGSSAMKLFATLATPNAPFPILRVLKWGLELVKHPLKMLSLLFSRKYAENTIILLVMQSIDNALKVVPKRWPFFHLSLKQSAGAKVPSYIDVGQKLMHDYAKAANGTAQNVLTEVLFNLASTAHVLGGVPMGLNSNDSVVNDKFEAHEYPGLYIVDGSIIPGNLGVNPSLTITAMAEYAMSHIAKSPKCQHLSLNEKMQKQAIETAVHH